MHARMHACMHVGPCIHPHTCMRVYMHLGSVFFSWRAASLNPYFEGCNPLKALDDDEVYRHTERRWITSPDGSGNLCSKESIEYLWKQITRPIQQGIPPFGLVRRV